MRAKPSERKLQAETFKAIEKYNDDVIRESARLRTNAQPHYLDQILAASKKRDEAQAAFTTAAQGLYKQGADKTEWPQVVAKANLFYNAVNQYRAVVERSANAKLDVERPDTQSLGWNTEAVRLAQQQARTQATGVPKIEIGHKH